MNERPCYKYWAVKCKTPYCAWLLLAFIQKHTPYHHPVIQHCRDFELTCEVCRAAHTYSCTDVEARDVAENPLDFSLSRAFLEAIQPETPDRQAPEH
jgi:hypothetical protein